MPRRPRNHELETESQRAFESALPANLVVRPVSDDYGVDREVEVFRDGKSTGLTFKVQLKGTDGSGATRRIKRDSLEYWRSLDVPVLLVSYEASTGTLRGRWVHSIGADGPDAGAEKLTVHMDPDIAITPMWADNLADDLSLVRELRRGVVPSPIPIRIHVDKSLAGLDVAVLSAELLRASRRGSWPLMAAAPGGEALTFELADDRLRVLLPLKVASASLRIEIDVPDHAGLRQLARDLLVLAAAAVAAVNQDAARELALASDVTSPLWETEAVSDRLGPVLATSASVDFLFNLVINLRATGTAASLHAAEWYQLMLFDLIAEVSAEAFDEFSDAARRAAAAEAKSSKWNAGRQLYNLGHLHKARRDYAGAAALFREAAALDPRYAGDAAWSRHLGSCEWELGEYAESVTHYRAALEQGYDAQELLPLLADSLMYAGEYGEAVAVLADWTPAGNEGDRLGIIRRSILGHIVEVVGLTQQTRAGWDPDDLKDRVQALAESDGVTKTGVAELLRVTDALHPLLWLMLTDGEDLSASFLPALTAASILGEAVDVWVVTLVSGLAGGVDEPLVRAVLSQARFHCGQDFYDAVWELAGAQETENADLLRRLIAETYSTEPVAFGTTVRFVNGPKSDSWVLEELWIGGPGAVPPAGMLDDLGSPSTGVGARSDPAV